MRSGSLFSIFLFMSFIIYQDGLCQKKSISDIISKNSKPEKLAGDFSFTEGPAADSKGNVYFTDQPNNRILVWSTENQLSVFMQPAGRSNGMFFDRNDNLWACADENNEIWIINLAKEVRVYSGKYNNMPFNGPNDIWVNENGGVYFTDPYYRRPWWKSTSKPQEKERVYYLSPDLETLSVVVDDLVQPNGIVGTPDGKTLYVADIASNRTWSYSINADGSLSAKKLFCNLGSDGMTIDSKGNLYLTGNGVTIFDSAGAYLTNIKIPEKWTANVCFGGSSRKDLFITASTGLYRLRMNVKGAF